MTHSPIDALVETRRRKPLARLAGAIRQGRAVLGFAGGSITDGRPGYTWPEAVVAWFIKTFPDVRFIVENAAIGATGSDSAVFRAQRDLIDRDCDIVFIEYVVNDFGTPSQLRRKTREGLIRKCLRAGSDLLLTYTFGQPMYEDMMAGRVPASVAEFEELAEHYGIGSVWMGLHALNEVRQGQMRWEEWLPDGVHPQYRGSLSYAQSVTACLEQELLPLSAKPSTRRQKAPRGRGKLPAPLDALNWEQATTVPLEDVRTSGPWSLRRYVHGAWIDQVWETAAVGATMEFDFRGRALAIGFDFGKLAADIRYRIDSGEWTALPQERPVWCGPMGWFKFLVIKEDLPAAPHRVQFEVVHGNKPDCTGTTFRLACIGIVP